MVIIRWKEGVSGEGSSLVVVTILIVSILRMLLRGRREKRSRCPLRERGIPAVSNVDLW